MKHRLIKNRGRKRTMGRERPTKGKRKGQKMENQEQETRGWHLIKEKKKEMMQQTESTFMHIMSIWTNCKILSNKQYYLIGQLMHGFRQPCRHFPLIIHNRLFLLFGKCNVVWVCSLNHLLAKTMGVTKLVNLTVSQIAPNWVTKALKWSHSPFLQRFLHRVSAH